MEVKAALWFKPSAYKMPEKQRRKMEVIDLLISSQPAGTEQIWGATAHHVQRDGTGTHAMCSPAIRELERRCQRPGGHKTAWCETVHNRGTPVSLAAQQAPPHFN